MLQSVAVAAGGAIGALLRFWMSSAVHAVAGRGFPYGTLAVNVLGSVLMGLLYVVFLERMATAGEWRAFWLIGMVGAFTTFSTFSIETLNLIEEGSVAKAGANVILSVVLCLAGAWLGIGAGRRL